MTPRQGLRKLTTGAEAGGAITRGPDGTTSGAAQSPTILPAQAPRQPVSRFARLRAMLAGTMANLMSASIVSMLLK